MAEVSTSDAFGALADGRWEQARDGFQAMLADHETADSAEAAFGMAMALWWLGENHAAIDRCREAYRRFRASGDVEGAARCAVWLAITYKANFGDFSVANGWLGRAERLLAGAEPRALHGWLAVARGYRMTDLVRAEQLTERAIELARTVDDIDLELVAMSQLGLIRVGQGDSDAGFDLIDEAMAAALAGDRSTLDTVVYTCCDMLNACELTSDLERATEWCRVAEGFVDRYGCPFLYAECRIYYGSILTARGQWDAAERELVTGVRITAGASPGLHARALSRVAALRVRQGRLEEAERLLTDLGDRMEVDAEVSLLAAALALARGEPAVASRALEVRLRQLHAHHALLATGLHVLVDSYLATDRLGDASRAAHRLAETAARSRSRLLDALAMETRGRVLLARGEPGAAAELDGAARTWSSLELPFETARAQFALARALHDAQPEIAIERARRALAGYEALGATGGADEVAAYLRSLGVVPPPGPKRPGHLTRREQQVLELLGAGLSNPEIAARLHISRKTAAHHVSNLLTKLGLRNRAEAAAHAVATLGREAESGRR